MQYSTFNVSISRNNLMVKIFFLAILIQYVSASCETASGQSFCNDMEMFEQCNYAQELINTYIHDVFIYNIDNANLSIITNTPQLECYLYIACDAREEKNKYGGLDECESIDAYNACVSAELKLSKFITNATQFIDIPEFIPVPTIECYHSNSNSVILNSGTVNYILILFSFSLFFQVILII